MNAHNQTGTTFSVLSRVGCLVTAENTRATGFTKMTIAFHPGFVYMGIIRSFDRADSPLMINFCSLASVDCLFYV